MVGAFLRWGYRRLVRRLRHVERRTWLIVAAVVVANIVIAAVITSAL
jgi:hypothetical protein